MKYIYQINDMLFTSIKIISQFYQQISQSGAKEIWGTLNWILNKVNKIQLNIKKKKKIIIFNLNQYKINFTVYSNIHLNHK